VLGTRPATPRRGDSRARQRGPDDVDLLRAEAEALRRRVTVLEETLDTIEGAVVFTIRHAATCSAIGRIMQCSPSAARHELIGERYEQLLARSIAARNGRGPGGID